MKRRSFLTLLTTLVAWVSMRPKLHADAINASLKPPDRPERVRIRLWCGETLVEQFTCAPGEQGEFVVAEDCRQFGEPEDWTRKMYHFVAAPSPTVRRDTTTFKRSMTHCDDLNEDAPIMHVHYSHVSGPKWWDVTAAASEFERAIEEYETRVWKFRKRLDHHFR